MLLRIYFPHLNTLKAPACRILLSLSSRSHTFLTLISYSPPSHFATSLSLCTAYNSLPALHCLYCMHCLHCTALAVLASLAALPALHTLSALHCLPCLHCVHRLHCLHCTACSAGMPKVTRLDMFLSLNRL